MNLQQIILRKLFRHRMIGEKHTAFEHITAGIPKHLHKEAKKAADILINRGLILRKPTNYGLQISLNPERLDEIIRIVEGH